MMIVIVHTSQTHMDVIKYNFFMVSMTAWMTLSDMHVKGRHSQESIRCKRMIVNEDVLIVLELSKCKS